MVGPKKEPFASSEPKGVVLVDLGLTEYGTARAKQKALVDQKKRAEVGLDYLLFVEHPEVYTFGRRSSSEMSPSLPNAVEVERGGQATYHNPGQLVCYPILGLKPGERDLHKHLRRLEGTLIDVLADFDLEGERRPGATGVWIAGKERKIASIGVAVSSWVTYHGSALNVCNDLSGFSLISPCGFSSEVMTSVEKELGSSAPSMEEVKESFLRHFVRHFERMLVV